MKDILVKAGFVFSGECPVCGGSAYLYTKGDRYAVKVAKDGSKFTMSANEKTIKGSSMELENAILTYVK